MSIALKPLSSVVGMEVLGFDPLRPIDADTANALREAFARHHLLLVRNPSISEEQQSRFGELFGDITIRHRYANQAEVKKAQFVSNKRTDGILGDGEIVYHQDHTFYDRPLSAIILYAIEIPKSGSATKFRKTGPILEHLPSELRAKAERVKCLHLYNYSGDYTKWQDPDKAPPDSPRAWQPLVWTNPKTGEKALWVIPISTVDFEGVSRSEGRELVDQIWNVASKVDDGYTYVHEWAPGDMLIWDNLMLQHARLPFSSNEARTLRRTPIV